MEKNGQLVESLLQDRLLMGSVEFSSQITRDHLDKLVGGKVSHVTALVNKQKD